MKLSVSPKPLSLLALWLVLPCAATQFIALSIEEIARKADLIVQGRVQSKTCARDTQGAIFTTVELAVAETWKGRATTNVSIVQSGGILGEEGAMIPGQANYEIGEEVVAFLVLNSRGEAVTLGLAHGKFHVWPHPQTGEKFARNLFHGETALEIGGQTNNTGRPSLAVVELKRRVLATKP